MLEQSYSGDWQIKDGKLYKGENLINGNFEIVDEIGKSSGDNVTVFQGDTRVATNVMKEGSGRSTPKYRNRLQRLY